MNRSTWPSVLENSQWAGRAAAGYSVLLTYLLLAPSPLEPFGRAGRTAEELVASTLADYVQHAAAYAVFAMVLLWAGRSREWLSPRVCLTLAAFHGVLSEFLQYYIPQRYFGWTDIAANLAGIGVGAWCAALVLRTAEPALEAGGGGQGLGVGD